MDEQLKVTFTVAFAKPEIVERQPLVPFLKELLSFTDGIISQFIPFL